MTATKITNEVYDYMLDDIQKGVLRARNKMEDVVKHLESHPTAARLYTPKARDLLERMRSITREIDELPALGSDES